MTHSLKILFISVLLTGLLLPGRLLGQDQPDECNFDDCEVILMDVSSRTDWTTNCDLVTIPRPENGEPDMRQICDPTFLILQDPTCGPEDTDSDFLELTEEEFCFDELLPCNAVGFRNFCMEATLFGDYQITNVGASAGQLVFNLAGCTKIYRSDDIFNPLCSLDGGGERIGVNLPAPSEANPMPSVEGKFDSLAITCSLDEVAAAQLFADACEDPANFCFDALSDGFIEITLSNGNLIAETIVTGSAKICASYATFDFEVLADLIEPNCGTCDDETSPNGKVPVSFVLPDDGNEGMVHDYENPSNYRIVIDDKNDGDNEWDQSITPDGSGTFEFTGLADSDYTVAIIYVPLAGDKTPEDMEACGFCVRDVTVGLIVEPEVQVEIFDDCVPSNGDPSTPSVGNGVIDLTVTGADNISFLWDNEATTPRIENLEAGQYCVTVTYGPPSSELDPTGRCAICLCFEVEEFSLTCDVLGDALLCSGEFTTLTANPGGGSGNYSFLWSTGETTPSITVSPETTTLYEVTITDTDLNSDCFVVCSREVEVFNLTCDIMGDALLCSGESTTLTASPGGGSGNYSFLWSNGETTPSITVSPATTTLYEVTITDDDTNGECFVICSREVEVFNLTCDIMGDAILCSGESTTLTASPGGGSGNYSFLWSTGETTPSITVSPAGNSVYEVTITDEDTEGACFVVCSREVEVFKLTCDILGSALICSGESTTLIADVGGGSGNYSFLWSTGETTPSITVSPTETTLYEVTITDEASDGECFVVCSTEVGIFNPTCEITGDLEIWLGAPATLTAQMPDGANFEYLWSNGETTPTITVYPVEATTYNVTITEIDDAGNPGCSFVCSQAVWVEAPTCEILGPDVVCGPQYKMELTVKTPTKKGNYHFEWSTGSTEKWTAVSPKETTTYSVTVTDLSDEGDVLCSFVCEKEITIIDPSCSISGNDEICNGESTDLTVEVTGGTGNYRYQWSNGKTGKTISVSPSATTTYRVTVTDTGAGACSFTCDYTVYVADLSCTISGEDRICEGSTTTLTANPVGGSGSYAYRWSTGETTPSITVSPNSNRTYRVTITDLDADDNPLCSSTCEYDVEVSSPVCTIIDRIDLACGEKGSMTFTVQGGFPPYNYIVKDQSGGTVASGTISENDALETVDGLMTGEYTVEITDAEGCLTSCSTVISEIIGEGGDFTGCLACNDKVNVTLDEDCAVTITLDMVAEGDIRDCEQHESLLQALEVIVYDGEYPIVGGQARPDDVVDKCGLFNYSIVLKAEYEDCFAWTQCWGQINAEDKSPTVEIKPIKVDGIYKYLDHYGNLQFTPYDCTSDDFETCFEDPYGYLHDDCSTFEFNYLVCDDLDSIYQEPRSYNDPSYPYFVGHPLMEKDCCGDLELIRVQDWVEEIPCEDRNGQITATIKRTFTYRNKQGMTATAVQEICFYRPKVILPDCKLHVDVCDFESAGGTNDLLSPDMVSSLTPDGEESIPYYFNGICEKVYLTDHACDLTASYVDQEFPAACGKKIIRTWSILDWCWDDGDSRSHYDYSDSEACYGELYYQEAEGYGYANKQTMKFEQTIIMEASSEMTVECRDVTVTTGPFNCTAVVAPPAPEISDCIAADFEFEVWGYVTDSKTGLQEYELIGHSIDGKLAGVPVGTYDLFYRIEDGCGRIYNGVYKGNDGEMVHDWDRACVLTVEDKIEPVAVCDDDLHVSIGGAGTLAEGLSKVTAADIDEGSWDNCGPVELEVRRAIDVGCLETYAERVHLLNWPSDYVARFEDGIITYLAGKNVPDLDIRQGDALIIQELGGHFYSQWSDDVYFTCCDISLDPQDKRTVELRATDPNGNANVCWLNILIEDKIAPRCNIAQSELSINCIDLDFDPTDSAQVAARFGAPQDMLTVFDNCNSFTYTEAQAYQPGNCGTGTLTRRITVRNGSGLTATCAQTITIEEVNRYTIKFPGDLESSTCADQPVSQLISAESQACDILAVNIDTTRFEASGSECFKQMLTYRVINWCEYDGVGLKPTVIPRDVDNDDDLSEYTLLEAGYETDIRSKYPVCSASGVYIPDEAFIVKVYDAGADGNKKDDYPVKVMFRDDCYDSNDDLVSHVGPLVLRLSSENLGGAYGTAPCYTPYCPTGEDVPTTADEYAAHVEDACRKLAYNEQCWTPGYFEYTQMIKVYDNEGPSLTIMGDQTFCAYGTPNAEAAFPCGTAVTLTFRLDDACTPNNIEARNVRLLVNRDPAETLTATSGLFTVVNTDPEANLYTISAPSLPVGQHAFVLNAVDGCGNVEGARFEFEIEDCKTPAPVCISRLSVDLMPTQENDRVGMNTVWATDFIAAPIRDCTPHEDPDILSSGPNDVKYFVFSERYLDDREIGPGDITLEDLTEEHTSVVFTCDDMPNLAVYIFALDGAGRFDYCTALAIIEPGNDVVCDDGDINLTSSIAGLITNEGMTPVAGVDVQLSGQASMQYQTDDSGNYHFEALTTGYDYTVTPSKDEDPLNGVSTFDLVLISKHILGVRPLDSPYKLIAADVNNSRSVTTLDLIQIRKLILSIDSQFSRNTSWRFIDAGYQFPTPNNPWAEQFPEGTSINDLEGSIEGDFIAVKIGDVNDNARANALHTAEVRNVAGYFELKAVDVAMTTGEEYIVEFATSELAGIQGYQFTLNYDGNLIELVDVIEGIAKDEHFGVFPEQGMITTSWNSIGETAFAGASAGKATDDQLFSLVLRAKRAAQLSEALSISSRLTRAEAYSTADELLDVALSFNAGAGSKSDPEMNRASFDLYQNQPNPFREKTLISFSLPEATTATLTFRDVNGRTLQVIRDNFNRGYNELLLENANFPSGMIYYTLKTETHTLTRKMVHLR